MPLRDPSLTTRHVPSFPSIAKHLGVMGCVIVIVLAGGAWPANAQDAATKVAKLNKVALDAFDNLNFDQAKTLLEQAISDSEAAGLANSAIAARSHLNLGMLLIAGFQQRDQAVEQFRAALKIQPDITAPIGQFNPEVQAVFDEVKAGMKSEAAAPASESPSNQVAARRARPPNRATPSKAAGGESENETDTDDGDAEETDEAPSNSGAKVLLSVGLGSGLGIAKGHLDANKDSLMDSTWSGSVAPSGLGHLLLGAGYFVSPDFMLSLEGRIQFVTGTTTVQPTTLASGTKVCVPSCSAPSTGIAVLAKATWFSSASGPMRPFLSAGIGAGSIREVVKINVTPNPAGQTGCGSQGTETCVDTVTGGPLLLAAGGGVSYQIGATALLGSLTANVGIPNVMLNVDAVLGLGFRL